jgi:hypothetical protein
MPELRYYLVTQVREVKVSATNPTDASILATRVFNNEKLPEDQINVQQWPRETELTIRED